MRDPQLQGRPPATVAEVAAYLRVRPRTVQGWIRAGQLRALIPAARVKLQAGAAAVRIGWAAVRVPWAAVEAILHPVTP
jgi:excisionase family DNA binding protein